MLRRLLPLRTSRNGIVVLLLLLPAVIFLTFYQSTSPPSFILDHPYFQYDLDALEPRNNDNQRCVLPRIHPFDPSVWGYLVPQKGIACKSRKGDLTTINRDGWLKFNETELQRSGYEIGKSLFCYWSKVERGGDTGNVDDVVSYGKESSVPKEGLMLPQDVEIVRVVCRNFANFAIYDRLHIHIRDARINSSIDDVSTQSDSRNFINVLIFGLDSLSRLAFIRHLPLTYKYLTEDLKMNVLRGMNKVGDNTYPNLIAFLTGKAVYGGDLPDYASGYDGWPLIWKNFSQAGYATMWAEDFPDFGLFNYLAPGFRHSPTLHYLRPFWLAMKDSPLLTISSHMCYGAKPRYLLQLEYLQEFVSVYASKGIPYFGFSFLAEITHEYMTRVSSADAHFRDFFQWLNDSGQLENTLLIVMSDHGHRFDAIRKTRVGHIEERIPFHAIHIPPVITPHQPKVLDNFRLNSHRLVTFFDVYATLVDLLEFVKTGRLLGTSSPPSGVLGRSLFGQISADRTCKDASIPPHYCVCETTANIDNSDPRAEVAAQLIVKHVNNLLKDTSGMCRKLFVSNVMSAALVKTMEDSGKGDETEQKVRVIVEAKPSMALFEATVILHDSSGEVWGDVSRINPYAGQSDCIRHAILRKYCFCADCTIQNAHTEVKL